MDFDKLLNSLDQLSIDKNRIPMRDFQKFASLYQKDSELSDAQVKSLSEEFLSKIDPYENINIVDESGNAIATLPRINNSTRTIDNKYEGAKSTFRNQANDEVPR